jgi:hypothetical protein
MGTNYWSSRARDQNPNSRSKGSDLTRHFADFGNAAIAAVRERFPIHIFFANPSRTGNERVHKSTASTVAVIASFPYLAHPSQSAEPIAADLAQCTLHKLQIAY